MVGTDGWKPRSACSVGIGMKVRPWLAPLLLAIGLAPTLHGEIRLPSLLADGMVLQQRSQATLWGQADPGERIRIQAGWLRKPVTVTAGPNGRWRTRLPTTAAGGPYHIVFKGRSTRILHNVLLGEVWVCAGQSNMEWTLAMLGGWAAFPDEGARLGAKGDPGLRLCSVPKSLATTPQDDCQATWHEATAEHVTPFSAVAYFYGRELRRRLRVPVGLISTAWGGTEAEAWTPRDWLARAPELVSTLHDPGGEQPNRPSVLYNAMIHPLLSLTIRGAIWYQGESNTGNADLYGTLFPTLIRAWRTAWKQGDFPFYFVQIAPYHYADDAPTSAYVRDAQRRALALPNTGMAVTLDIAEPTDLHPKAKPEIARRLALWALARTYHRKVGAISGPLLRSTSREGGALRLTFEHTDGGLRLRTGPLTGFEIAAKGGPFLSAEAAIDGATLRISHPGVLEPAEVRYAFSHAPEASLFNGAGLPASPFQTEWRPLLLRPVQCQTRWDPTSAMGRVTLTCSDPRTRIRVTLDGRDPGPGDQQYSTPLALTAETHLRARAFLEGRGSEFIHDLHFAPHSALGKQITLTHPPHPKYPGTPGALTDGFEGSADFTDGRWLGFEGEDAELLLDLGQATPLGAVSVVFLEDPANWIFSPRRVEAAHSVDGITFTSAAPLLLSSRPGLPKPLVRMATPALPSGSARFLRLQVKNLGICPSGHAGAGEKAWLFISEVKVEHPSAPPPP